MYFQPYGDDQQLNLNWIINEIINLHKQLDPDYETPSFTQVYPYSNLNRLNLDWVLSELKALKQLAPQLPTETIQGVAQAIIAEPYNPNREYAKGDYISADGVIYRAIENTTGEYDADAWQATTIGADLTTLENVVSEITGDITTVEQKVSEITGDITTVEQKVDSFFLAATGDNTDRTSEIVSILNANKKCILGVGEFYTTGIDMPDNTTIFGMGDASVLKKTGNGDFVIKLNKHNTVENICVDGNNTVTETKGNHNGILWS